MVGARRRIGDGGRRRAPPSVALVAATSATATGRLVRPESDQVCTCWTRVVGGTACCWGGLSAGRRVAVLQTGEATHAGGGVGSPLFSHEGSVRFRRRRRQNVRGANGVYSAHPGHIVVVPVEGYDRLTIRRGRKGGGRGAKRRRLR